VPVAVVLAVAAMLMAASSARANGRFPRAERLAEDPSNPDRLMLAATYGLVTTTDRGNHWYHTCEAEFAGDPSYSGDPLLELVAGGAALVDVQAFVGRSADACGWSPTLGSPGTPGQTFDDIAVDGTRMTVVALQTTLADGSRTIGLQRSDDAGVTWRPVGTPLPAAEVFSIDLDPTDAMHVYATGLSAARTGIFLASTDGGSTWQSWPIPNTGENAFPYIAAVDPNHPSTVYVRTDSWILPDGAPEEVANDALFVSPDGGQTWTQLLQEPAKLLGFALSPDGSTILAGYGDPVEPDYFVDDTATGIYVATANDPQFSLTFPQSVTCLTWTPRGIYACLEEQSAGTVKELALFDGAAALDGGSPQMLMRLSDILGPPPCCSATDSVCDWLEVCPTLGIAACGDGGALSLSCTDADGGTSADAAPDATKSADPVDAAPTPPERDAGAVAGDVPAATGRGGGGGCSCRTGPRESFDGWGVASLIAVAAAARVHSGRRKR
jgi:hypothetical protein